MKTNSRSPEIDIARVAAIFLMIAFHAAYDLSVFHGWNIDVHSGVWWLVGKLSALLFLLLSGMSFSLSWARTPDWKKYVRRGAIIFSYGLVISFITYLIDSNTYVRFGILHLIGLSMMILPAITKLRYWNVALACSSIAIGMYLKNVTGNPFTVLFGATPESYTSIDYYPMFPWIGAIIFGVSLGQLFLLLSCPTLFRTHPKWLTIFTYLSRKSLLIYLMHQPLIILSLWLIFGKQT